MGRPSKPRWDDERKCWRTTVGGRRLRFYDIAPGDIEGVYRRLREEKEKRAGAAAGDAPLTVYRLCAAYLDWQLGKNGAKPKTVANHKFILRLFGRFAHGGVRYGERPAASITATDLGRVRVDWEARGYRPGYTAHLYKSVLACWKWAARPVEFREPERLLEANPLEGLKRPRGAPGRDRHAETGEAAALLWYAWRRVNRADWKRGTLGRCMACMKAGRPGPCRRRHDATAAKGRDAVTLLRLIAATGMRPGEACGARWADWNPAAYLDGATGQWWGLLLVEHKTQRLTGRKRPVAVPPTLVRALERIRARRGRHPEFVFAHRRGRGSVGRGESTASAGTPWNTTALGQRLKKWRDGAAASGVRWRPDRDSAWRPVATAKDEALVLYAMRHRWYTAAAHVVGADAAGRAGGSGGAVVRAVYYDTRPELVAETAREVRAARKGKGKSGG